MPPKLPRYNCHRHRARNAARHPAALLDRPMGRYGDDPGDLATKPFYADGRRDPRRQPRPRNNRLTSRDLTRCRMGRPSANFDSCTAAKNIIAWQGTPHAWFAQTSLYQLARSQRSLSHPVNDACSLLEMAVT